MVTVRPRYQILEGPNGVKLCIRPKNALQTYLFKTDVVKNYDGYIAMQIFNQSHMVIVRPRYQNLEGPNGVKLCIRPKTTLRTYLFKTDVVKNYDGYIDMANFQPITHGNSETALPNSRRAEWS